MTEPTTISTTTSTIPTVEVPIPATVTPVPVPSTLSNQLVFPSNNVVQLSSNDFVIDSQNSIRLKNLDCTLVLFYVQNTESNQLATIWSLISQQVPGPNFGAVNMTIDKTLAAAFTRLAGDGNNPMSWAGMRQYPVIIVYRSGNPVAIYNGPREIQAMVDYASNLACQPNYYEMTQLGGGIQAETRLEMGPYTIYRNIQGQPPVIKRSSVEFTPENPIRGFNPTVPLNRIVRVSPGETSQPTAQTTTATPIPINTATVGESGPTPTLGEPR